MKIFLLLMCLGLAQISWAQPQLCNIGCLISGSGSIDANGDLSGDGEAIKFTKDGNGNLQITYQRRAPVKACLWWGYSYELNVAQRWRGSGGWCHDPTSFPYKFDGDGGTEAGESVKFGCPGDIYCDGYKCWVWADSKKDRCKDISRSWNERLNKFNPDIYQAVIGSPTAISFSSQVYTVAFLENSYKFTVLLIKQTLAGSNVFEIKDLSPPAPGFYKGYGYSNFVSTQPGVYTLSMAANSCPTRATYNIRTDATGVPISATLSFPPGSNCVFSKADKIPPRPSNFAIPNVP